MFSIVTSLLGRELYWIQASDVSSKYHAVPKYLPAQSYRDSDRMTFRANQKNVRGL